MSGYGDERGIEFSPRCWRCQRRLAEYLSTPYSLKCQRCHAPNVKGPIPSLPDASMSATESSRP